MLIDVTATFTEAGLRIPTALTSAAHALAVALPDGYKGCQDEKGRLWDVAWMCACAARTNRANTRFVFTLRSTDPKTNRARNIKLVAQLGAGDDDETVLTIMCEGED